MNEYLPFTRPTIDEQTIAEVGDVLRSGWITSGPKVAEFETKLAEYLGASAKYALSCMPPAPWKRPWWCAASGPVTR